MNVVQINARRAGGPAMGPDAIPTPLNAANACLNGLGGIRKARRPAGRRLSAEKIALIHVAKHAVRMAEDSYRAMLREVAGVASSTELTEGGFAAVMHRFQVLGFKGRHPAAGAVTSAERIGMATTAQLDYIAGLWQQWAGRRDDVALTRWIEAKFHISSLRFVDVVTAQKAIEGLKAMNSRKARAQQGAHHD